ncbi:ASPIC and UnbV [Planctomycetes bacterium CA13]|uniref:ASPIC and UnbV n=1 Tax=Novipirellula herctigrandis TaxID=2527986 RepID=A0A5C5ZCT7_9BACT|nr:ASPIC and UnbV [Planctomycetes bacterium CA13]
MSLLVRCFLLTSILLVAGCEKAADLSTRETPPATLEPLQEMRLAMRRKEWQEAWTLSNAVLTQHSNDPTAIATVAEVAYENEKLEIAGDLMLDACRAESFENSSRVQQAMGIMLAAGRMHDCIEMFEEVLVHQPMQHDIRRRLHDMYWGTEDRVRSLPHGRFLVRNRQFDRALLLALNDSEVRTESAEPLVEMAKRNPNDQRPLIAEAKILFDRGDRVAAVGLLRGILNRYPNHAPSLALLGRAFVASGRFDEFISLARSADTDVGHYPAYWIALGDWSRSRQLQLESTRAYWEATRRNANSRAAWTRLSTSLRQFEEGQSSLDSDTMKAIETRVLLLSQISELMSRLSTSGVTARADAIEMATALRGLGRLWEAEAWASIAMTLPEDDSVPVVEIRESILKTLRKDTPWQDTKSRLELELDLTRFPLPPLEPKLHSVAPRNDHPIIAANSTRKPHKIKLVNEATERALHFFGRTGEHLEKPGVMLYQTVGCGGGAIDFDLDGWCDLYLAAAGGIPPYRNSETNGLMRNIEGVFLDVTEPSRTGDTGFGQGVAIGDVNEDGFADILVLNYGPNTLLVNNGDGTFCDASHRLHESEGQSSWSTSGAVADLDSDGLADLTILNYCIGLEPVTQDCPQKGIEIARACAPLVFPGCPDRFLHNGGEGDFVDRTSQWNATPMVIGRGLGVVAGSFDQERGVDVFIANDMTSNHFWTRSNTSETRTGFDFQLNESAILRGLGSNERSPAQGSMGIATGDLDRDGDLDFYVTNFVNESNTYHNQHGPGLWRDQTTLHQLDISTLPLVGFGTQAVDFDNDTKLELVVSNGHVDSYPSGERATPYSQPMQVFKRTERNEYTSIEDAIGGEYLDQPHIGRALWTLDANRDGLTDLAVTHQTEPVALLVNRTDHSGHWIDLQLCGRHCSRDAVGAIVEVQSEEQRWTAAQTSGDGFLCSNERVVHIGTGDSSHACDVTVTWPDGRKQTYAQLASRSRWLLVQEDVEPFELSH